jgi:hypothetical protein
MSIDEVKSQRGLKMTIGEAVAVIALIITILSGLNGWLVIPEKLRGVQEENSRQDQRITAMETMAYQKSEILARIDERTRRIEEAVKIAH